MLRCLIYVAQSLDGFIADTDGGVEWLAQFDDSFGLEDYGYHEFLDSVDTIVMGRSTFEKVLSFGDWPYDEKRVVVLSSRELDLPDELSGNVTVMAGPPAEIAAKLADEQARQVYVDGGKTASSFLAAGLIDELTLTTVPLILGSGRPLFSSLNNEIPLEHLETRTFPNGLVQTRYRTLREG